MSGYVDHAYRHAPRAEGGTDTTHKGRYEIKLFADTDPAATGDGAFVFAIPADLHRTSLFVAHGFVSAAGSGDTVFQVRNVTGAVDMLTDPVTIDSGETTSYSSGSPSAVDPANNQVATGDLVAIDVDTAGSGALGLGAILVFS